MMASAWLSKRTGIKVIITRNANPRKAKSDENNCEFNRNLLGLVAWTDRALLMAMFWQYHNMNAAIHSI